MKKFLIRPFMCSICTMTFARRPDMMHHVTRHHKNCCYLCQKSFATKSDLMHHMEGPTCNIRYSCSGCEAIFSSRDDLSAHYPREHAPDNPHSCDVCQKTFRYKISLTKHKKVHNCKYCDLTFVKAEDSTKHRNDHVGEYIYCSLCKRSFRVCSVDFTHRCNRVSLEEMSSVESVYRYSCFLCKKAFEDKDALLLHIEEAYANNLICCVCKKSFDHKQNVADHFNMHTSVKNFPCGLCWRTFSNGMRLLVHLSIHIRNHGNRKSKLNVSMNGNDYVPEKIPACEVSQGAAGSPNLLKHSKVETKLTMILKLKPHLVCEVCKETFEQEKHLLEHAKLHTPIPLLTCDVCKGTFTKTQEFFNHVKMQTSNLVMFCDVCKGTFTQERHLTMHLHTGGKLFTCTMCKNTFTDKEEILSHIMEVHKRKEPVYCQQCKKPSQKTSSMKMSPSVCKVDSIKDNAGTFGEDSSHSNSSVSMVTVADLGTGTSQAKKSPRVCKVDSIGDNAGNLGESSSSSSVTMVTMADLGTDTSKVAVNGKRSLCGLCDKDCTVFRPAVDQVVFCDECEHSSVSCSLCNRNVQFSKLRLHVGQHIGE